MNELAEHVDLSASSATSVSVSYLATADSVPAARRALVQFAAAAGARVRQLEQIELAVCEAMTNVVVHAYRDRDRPGLIHVTAALVERELWIVIADDGCGLRAREDSPGLGQGLRLIALVADALTIVKRSSGGTELQMRFDLGGGGQAAEDQSRGSVSAATAPASSRLSTTT
jgi:serine/threonine-protein kinase RsbW